MSSQSLFSLGNLLNLIVYKGDCLAASLIILPQAPTFTTQVTENHALENFYLICTFQSFSSQLQVSSQFFAQLCY